MISLTLIQHCFWNKTPVVCLYKRSLKLSVLNIFLSSSYSPNPISSVIKSILVTFYQYIQVFISGKLLSLKQLSQFPDLENKNSDYKGGCRLETDLPHSLVYQMCHNFPSVKKFADMFSLESWERLHIKCVFKRAKY